MPPWRGVPWIRHRSMLQSFAAHRSIGLDGAGRRRCTSTNTVIDYGAFTFSRVRGVQPRDAGFLVRWRSPLCGPVGNASAAVAGSLAKADAGLYILSSPSA